MTSAPKRLDHWYPCLLNGYYAMPDENRRVRLAGSVGGKDIYTSRVASTSGRLVTTESGSVYELGEADPEWVAWLGALGIALDAERPMRVGGQPR
jgi:hypothetical protein